MNGMKVTTHKARALRSMRVRANTDFANPNDFESQPNLLHPIQDVRRCSTLCNTGRLMFRCSLCTRVTTILLLRTQSHELSTLLSPWSQPRSSWIKCLVPLVSLFKSSSLEWTRQPRKGISAVLFKAGRCSKVRPQIDSSIWPTIVQKSIQIFYLLRTRLAHIL